MCFYRHSIQTHNTCIGGGYGSFRTALYGRGSNVCFIRQGRLQQLSYLTQLSPHLAPELLGSSRDCSVALMHCSVALTPCSVALVRCSVALTPCFGSTHALLCSTHALLCNTHALLCSTHAPLCTTEGPPLVNIINGQPLPLCGHHWTKDHVLHTITITTIIRE